MWSPQKVLERHWVQVFRMDIRDLSRSRRLLILGARLLYIGWRKSKSDLFLERAASLAFTATVSIVPAIILLFALFRAFGDAHQLVTWQDQIKGFLENYVSPEKRAELAALLDNLLSSLEAQSRGVERVALGFLVIVVLSLYRSAERTFSQLWNVHQTRSYLRKLGNFWLVLTATPMFLAGSVYVEGVLAGSLGVFLPWFSPLVTLALSLGGFLLMILYLPNTRVHFGPALAGAAVAALLWQLLNQGFTLYLRHAFMTGVYGALGVVPFFLLWIYLSWCLAILGATLSYCLQHYLVLEKEVRFHLDPERTPAAVLALLLLERVYESFQEGGAPVDMDALGAASGLPLSEVGATLEVLMAQGYLARDEAGAYTPRRAPERLSPFEVMQAFPTGTGFKRPTGRMGDGGVARFLQALEGQANQLLATTTFADMLADRRGRSPAEPASPPPSPLPEAGRGPKPPPTGEGQG